MEGDARDDVMTPHMGLESDGNVMEKGIADDSMTPHIGMEFSTSEDAYEFYNQYALKTGFGVRRSSTEYSRTDKNKVISKKYVCCKEGYRNASKINKEAAQDVHNCEVRVGCNARMKIILTNSNTWKVSVFVKKHDNHELTSPSKTLKHRSHKKVHRKASVKKLMTELHNKGIQNSEIARIVNVFESNQYDTVTSQQVHDHLRIGRKNNALTEVHRNLYLGLQYKGNIALDEARKSPVFAKEFDTLLSKMLAKVDNQNKVVGPVISNESSTSKVGSTTTPPSKNINLFHEITIRAPTGCAKTKGRSMISSRIQSELEVSQEGSSKKQRTCGFCGEKGHYKTGCAKAKASAATTSDHQEGSSKKQRTCGFCGEKGHYKTGCAKAKASAATTSDHQFL